jgi:hypothetical protein
MTMHLCGPALTTTGKSRSKFKYASAEHKARAEQAEADWKALQKRWGVEAEERQRRRGLTQTNYTPPQMKFRGAATLALPSLNSGQGVATKTEAPVYTGTKVLGISTLHKSNGIPVFSQEEAVEISKMRR